MRLLSKSLLLLLLVVLAGCSQSPDQPELPIDGSYKPTKSLKDAVNTMLAADQRGDYAASFAVLSPEARRTYKDVASWAERRRELPATTGFQLGDRNGSTQVAMVNHVPGLDPFKGLSAGEERQSWVGRERDEGWLLDADPQTEPVLPPDSSAAQPVTNWAQSVQACDRDRARSFQAIDTLFATTAPPLCRAPGEVRTGPVERLPEGPASSSIVSQYSADAFYWARVVPVQSPIPLKVIVAPIGNEWKVLGLYA